MFPIALLALLIGTTLGVVWHHHATSSPDNCPICHMSHQAIEPPLANAKITALAPAGDAPEIQNLSFAPIGGLRQVAARAPPA